MANEQRRRKRIKSKIEQTFRETLITDLRRLFAEVRDTHWPEGIQDKEEIMRYCSYYIRDYARNPTKYRQQGVSNGI